MSMNDQNNSVAAAPTHEPYWNDGRKVFMLWAVIVLVGFLGTQYDQSSPEKVNGIWVVLSLVGLAYMKMKMSFQYADLKKIYLTWLVLIFAGIAYSEWIFYSAYAPISQYLGGIWLFIMALGHAITGLIDKKKLYVGTTLLQVVAGFAVIYSPELAPNQYLVAGIVGALSMIALVLYA